MKLLIKPLNEHGHYNKQVDKPQGDAGIDLFFPNDVRIPRGESVLVDFEIQCEMLTWTKNSGYDLHVMTDLDKPFNCSYQLVPRSSIWRTPLRQSNSIGIIDAGYRGHIMVPVDNISNEDYIIKRGERLFQIVHPSLEPIKVELTDTLSETERGSGGFGSTGK
jgi:dUTP pyrophosphatase